MRHVTHHRYSQLVALQADLYRLQWERLARMVPGTTRSLGRIYRALDALDERLRHDAAALAIDRVDALLRGEWI